MKSVTYWWIFLYKLRWKRKSNHLDNQDILFAFMNIASKSNPLKPLKCTLRKKWWSYNTIPVLENNLHDRGYQWSWIVSIWGDSYNIQNEESRQKHLHDHICRIWYAAYQMHKLKLVRMQLSEVKKFETISFRIQIQIDDRRAWIKHHFIKSICFFQIVPWFQIVCDAGDC